MNTVPNNHAAMLNRSHELQTQFARKLVTRLAAGEDDVPHDISERLRVARMQALAVRRKPQAQTQWSSAPVVQMNGSAASLGLGGFGEEKFSLFNRFASILPILALIIGLVAINIIQNDDGANEMAEVDAALLTDDLPPAAYVDPGFAHFLKVSQDTAQ